MSTLRLLPVFALTLAISSTATVAKPIQYGGGPTKLYGPALISASSSSQNTPGSSDGTYTYTVELDRTSSVNTTVYVTTVSEAVQPTVYTVVVPPQQLTASFEVVAASPGTDWLVASNVNGQASMEILVL